MFPKALIRMKVIADQRGVSETIQYGGLAILTGVILIAAGTALAPNLDSAVSTVTGKITSTYTAISGL